MAEELTRREVRLEVLAPREGYLETTWFDATTGQAAAPPFGVRPTVVKLRAYADPVGRRTRLFVEAVVRVAWDPSVPERELERMIPDGHPARALVAALVDGLRPAPQAPAPEPR